MAIGFASPKVTVVISDGCEYLQKHSNEFDVIITDSSDPDGEYVYILKINKFFSCSFDNF